MKSKFSIILCLVLVSVAFVHSDEEDSDLPNDNEDVNTDETTNGEKKGEIPTENNVLVLTHDNFDTAIEENENILVEFYAPWCGHCKSLAPEYDRAAGNLKLRGSNVALAKVDATEHNAVAQRFEVSGYPTLKFFKDGEVMDYDGPRDAQGIEDWLLQRTDPSWRPPPDDVVVLGADNFTEFINSHDLSLVEFYAPWCGHCKKLAPEYSQAAKHLKENTDPIVPLAKVDATIETSLAGDYDVTGYPTLFMFRKGRKFEYKGERDKWGIIDYMQKQMGDASKLLSSQHAVKSSFLKDDITVMGFFDNEEAAAYQLYQDAASDLREDFTMYHIFDVESRKEFRVNANSMVIFYPEQFHSKHEPKWRTYEIKEETTASQLRDFIKKHCVPLVGELTDQNKEKRYSDKRPLVVVFYSVDFGFDYREATQLWRRKMVEIAKDYKDELTFAVADDEKMGTLFKEFGYEDSGEEINIGILDDKALKFPMEPMDEFDADEIHSFIRKYKAGKLKPRVKSQPKPKSNKNPVITVVGKTFDEIVMQKDKDVFIEMYAPWCGHCKNLEPIWKDLAKKYKKEKNLIIAKMDATANDAAPGYDVSGFPTIYWAPKGSDKSQPIKYEGERSLDDFVTYLEENSAVLKQKKDEL